MNKSSVFSAQRSTSFQILYCVLVRYTRTHQSNTSWDQRLEWFKSTPESRNLDRIDGEPMECEWNIFPGFKALQLSQEVKELQLRLNETPQNFTGRIIFMSMFNDISWRSKGHKIECESDANLVSIYNKIECETSAKLVLQEDLEQDNGHFSVLVQRESGILSVKIVHKVNGTEWQRRWCWHSQKADIQSSVPRVHCPAVSSKAKEVEHCRSNIVPIWKRLRLFFS